MKLEEIRSLAKSWGSSPGKLSQIDQNQSIRSEGIFAMACGGPCGQQPAFGLLFNAAMKGALS